MKAQAKLKLQGYLTKSFHINVIAPIYCFLEIETLRKRSLLIAIQSAYIQLDRMFYSLEDFLDPGSIEIPIERRTVFIYNSLQSDL